MELMKRVEAHEQFIFHGKQIEHVEDLISVLKEASDEDYAKYADKDRNDFANWVQHVLNNEDVANKLRTSESREDTIKLLEDEVVKRKSGEVSVLTQETTPEVKEEPVVQEPALKESVVAEQPTPIVKTPLAEESVLQSNSDIMSSTPVDKPSDLSQTLSEEPKEETVGVVSSDALKSETSSVKPISDTPIVTPENEITDQSSNILDKPVVKEPVVEDSTLKPVMETPIVEEPVVDTLGESKIEEKPSIISQTNTINIDKESDDKSVLAPMNTTNPKEITDKAKVEEVYEHHFFLAKKEFVFGLGVGMIIGILLFQMIRLITA